MTTESTWAAVLADLRESAETDSAPGRVVAPCETTVREGLVYTGIFQRASDRRWTIARFRRDVEVVSDIGGNSEVPQGGLRGRISELSHESRQRMAFVVANSPVEWAGMLTLTYQWDIRPCSGKETKAHLNAYLTSLKRRYPGIKLFWFLEFTRRGAVHYHILTSNVPVQVARDSRGRCWCPTASRNEGKIWAGLWGRHSRFSFFQGFEKRNACMKAMEAVSARWEPIREIDGGARYARAYASKPHQKQVPSAFQDVGRWWGHSRGVAPVHLETMVVSEGEYEVQTGEKMRKTLYGVPFHIQFGMSERMAGFESRYTQSDGRDYRIARLPREIERLHRKAEERRWWERYEELARWNAQCGRRP